MQLAFLLFVLAKCGSSITIWKMAKIGKFLMVWFIDLTASWWWRDHSYGVLRDYTYSIPTENSALLCSCTLLGYVCVFVPRSWNSIWPTEHIYCFSQIGLLEFVQHTLNRQPNIALKNPNGHFNLDLLKQNEHNQFTLVFPVNEFVLSLPQASSEFSQCQKYALRILHS